MGMRERFLRNFGSELPYQSMAEAVLELEVERQMWENSSPQFTAQAEEPWQMYWFLNPQREAILERVLGNAYSGADPLWVRAEVESLEPEFDFEELVHGESP